MNFDELMAAWRSQDTAPLHDVNKALLQQALRDDEARLQKTRRRERRILYAASAFVIFLMPLLLLLMIRGSQSHRLAGLDFVVGLCGMTAALLAGILMFIGNRAQLRLEERFGDSLRDQINRRIAQVDDVVTGIRRTVLGFVLLGAVCPLAILHLGMRVNHKTLGDVRLVIVLVLLWCLWAGARAHRRSVKQANSRKHHLEALLKELDRQE